MSKPRWADIMDDELEIPIIVSKHGIKVKKPAPPPVPPLQSQDKTKPHIENKK